MIDHIEQLHEMVQLALMAADKPPKALAMELHCSLSAVHQALKGTRTIPASVMRKFAENNLIAAASMALQATGLSKLFRYRKSDRHILARVTELKMLDRRADEHMNKMPELLFNKNTPSDLTEEEKKFLKEAVGVMMERDNAALNLFMELDTRYKLDIVKSINKKPRTVENRHRGSQLRSFYKL